MTSLVTYFQLALLGILLFIPAAVGVIIAVGITLLLLAITVVVVLATIVVGFISLPFLLLLYFFVN